MYILLFYILFIKSIINMQNKSLSNTYSNNTIKFNNSPEFKIVLIGQHNSLQFHFLKQELLRLKDFLFKKSRKNWNMELSCQQYEDY